MVYSVIRTLGPTLRYEVLGWQHAERVYAANQRCIWAFWHRVIIPIAWWARNRGIVVMNTTAFDGQWTRKVIEWLGFGTAQGSSSRGGLRGLAVMAKRLAEGLDCALHDRRPARPALRRQARSGHARSQDRLPHRRVPHRRRPRQNFRENLGPFPAADAVRPHGTCSSPRRSTSRQTPTPTSSNPNTPKCNANSTAFAISRKAGFP